MIRASLTAIDLVIIGNTLDSGSTIITGVSAQLNIESLQFKDNSFGTDSKGFVLEDNSDATITNGQFENIKLLEDSVLFLATSNTYFKIEDNS